MECHPYSTKKYSKIIVKKGKAYGFSQGKIEPIDKDEAIKILIDDCHCIRNKLSLYLRQVADLAKVEKMLEASYLGVSKRLAMVDELQV